MARNPLFILFAGFCGGDADSKSKDVGDWSDWSGAPKVKVDHSWPVKDSQTCQGKEEQFGLCNADLLCGTCVPQDCAVSDWNEWSSGDCTGLCERERRIVQHNNECGTPCNKSLVETQGGEECLSCSAPEEIDCKWGSWTDWSACTCPCGGGQHTRDRRIETSPKGGGKMCEAKNRTEIAPCNLQSCGPDCVNGDWAAWGDWGSCSHSCGGGTRWRSREVKTEANECGEPAVGFSQEYEQCNEAVSCSKDVDCEFGDWSAWSDCSCTCDGVKRRSRSIATYGSGSGKWCFGPTKQIDQCNPGAGEGPPPGCGGKKAQDCVPADWKDWTDCTATCGGGQMVRMRRITSEAKSGGAPCNTTIGETMACGVDPCRLGKKTVNCLWGDWGDWGACDKCGGEKRRYRHIEKMPENGGAACENQPSEEFSNCTRHCHDRQYCVWSDWSSYGDCTTTCGPGYQKRDRTLKLLQAAPPPVKDPSKLYEDLRSQAQQVQSSRTQEMVIAFACGCVSFVVMLSAGRALRSSASVVGSNTREMGLE